MCYNQDCVFKVVNIVLYLTVVEKRKGKRVKVVWQGQHFWAASIPMMVRN